MKRRSSSPRFTSSVGFLFTLLILATTITGQMGCLKKPALPASKPGRLDLRIYIGNQSPTTRATINDLRSFLIRLTNKKAQLSKERIIELQSLPPAEEGVDTSFTDLYPGIWEVDVYGLNHEDKIIFRGGNEVEIKPGGANRATIHLIAGPGRLRIILDASQISGFGDTINSGRLYVYLDPTSGRSTSFPLSPDGTLLKGEAELDERSYSFRVAVPQLTGAIYLSSYYNVDIVAGETFTQTIAPDNILDIITILDPAPATPTGFTLNREGDTIILTWEEISEDDLNGYFIYRTDDEGRFVRLAESNVSTYTDTIKESLFYKGQIGYAVSSFDHGGNESLWSVRLYVSQH
jgi:hypothetical protein